MRPVLVLNPPDDTAFESSVQDALGTQPEDFRAFQNALRRSYASAAVHVREIADEPTVIWYVYRDGRWVGPRKEA
jgi:hypothetical protein